MSNTEGYRLRRVLNTSNSTFVACSSEVSVIFLIVMNTSKDKLSSVDLILCLFEKRIRTLYVRLERKRFIDL